jgi:hypothetical protein
VPAAAVIPAPIAYINIVAVKKLVVWGLDRCVVCKSFTSLASNKSLHYAACHGGAGFGFGVALIRSVSYVAMASSDVAERILAFRSNAGEEEYLVKLRGQSVTAARWMKADSIPLAGSLVLAEYRFRLKLDQRPSSPVPEPAEEEREQKQDSEEDETWRSPASEGKSMTEKKNTPIAPFDFNPDGKEPVPSWMEIMPGASAAAGSRVCDVLPRAHTSLLLDGYLSWRAQPMTIPASTMVRNQIPPMLHRLRFLRGTN